MRRRSPRSCARRWRYACSAAGLVRAEEPRRVRIDLDSVRENQHYLLALPHAAPEGGLLGLCRELHAGGVTGHFIDQDTSQHGRGPESAAQSLLVVVAELREACGRNFAGR